MRPQVYFEDVKEGDELPTSYSLHLDELRMHLQTSGTQDYHRQHHDVEFARKQGQPNAFINTGFYHAALSRVVTDWMGDEGWLQIFSMQMRKMNYPQDTMTMKGKITKKYIKDSQGYVECEVWAENQREGVTTPGSAIVILPLRGK